MSRRLGAVGVKGRRFPRVSGDEPSEALRVYTSGVFSPRERG